MSASLQRMDEREDLNSVVMMGIELSYLQGQPEISPCNTVKPTHPSLPNSRLQGSCKKALPPTTDCGSCSFTLSRLWFL